MFSSVKESLLNLGQSFLVCLCLRVFDYLVEHWLVSLDLLLRSQGLSLEEIFNAGSSEGSVAVIHFIGESPVELGDVSLHPSDFEVSFYFCHLLVSIQVTIAKSADSKTPEDTHFILLLIDELAQLLLDHFECFDL